jgi:hypothetical protein
MDALVEKTMTLQAGDSMSLILQAPRQSGNFGKK